MIPASGAGGPGFDSQLSPFFVNLASSCFFFFFSSSTSFIYGLLEVLSKAIKFASFISFLLTIIDMKIDTNIVYRMILIIF